MILFLNPRFQRSDYLLQYKPYPAFPDWDTAWDLEDIYVAVEILAAGVVDAGLLAADAATLAGMAISDAADAQATADAALAAAQGAKHQLSMMGDEANWVVGTPARTISASYPYNFGVFTNAVPAEMQIPFDAAAGTWTINIHVFKGSNAGSLNFSIDADWSVSFEAYQAANTFTHLQTYTGVVLTGGVHRVFKATCGAHHASSTGYVLLIWKVFGYRTGV